MNRRRLLLAMEHDLLRAAMTTLIEKLGGVRVVAVTGNGREAVALSKTHRPALALIETGLAEIEGSSLVDQILHWSPRTQVILLETGAGGRPASRGVRQGSKGLLSGTSSPRDLDRLLNVTRTGTHVGNPLTARQLEVLKHLSEGGGVKQIARLLGISVKTVETHRSQLMDRLRIYDLPGLVRYALREKITHL